MLDVKSSYEPNLDKLKFLLGKFTSGEEVGVSINVDLEGQTVVDIWGDYIDEQHIKLWEKDTIVNVWSSTKVILTLITLMLLDRGLLNANDKLAKYWPEFGVNGTKNIEVRQILSPDFTLNNWGCPVTIEDVYALVRRTDGRSLDQFVAEELDGSLGTDFHRRVVVERRQEGRLQRRLRPLTDVHDTPSPQAEPASTDSSAGESAPTQMARLYPDSIPQHPLHPYAIDFSVLDQGPIGKALVTHRRWYQGDFMARFDGITVPEIMLHTLQKTDRVHLWDPHFIGNLAHSCGPNVMLDMAEHEIWAVQDIEPGTILSMDYASTEDRLFRTFKCGCHAPGCRGEVTGRKQRRTSFESVSDKTV